MPTNLRVSRRGLSSALLRALPALVTATLLTACGNSAQPMSSGPGGGGGSPVDPPVLGDKKLTVIVAVVDSLMPQEITASTPNLNTLKSEGTFYEESRAVFSAETTPNHAAMMTGVYPQRNGIATNNFLDFFDLANPVERDLSLPEEYTANTAFTWIDRQCRRSGINPEIRTAATLSKKYLFELFQGDAFNAERANRNPNVFNVNHDDSRLWLNDNWTKPENQWNLDNAIVFRLGNCFLSVTFRDHGFSSWDSPDSSANHQTSSQPRRASPQFLHRGQSSLRL